MHINVGATFNGLLRHCDGDEPNSDRERHAHERKAD